MVNKFLRRRVLLEVVVPTPYDDATVIYSLRKFFGWNKAILKVRRSSDNAVKWVFFHGNTITLNSLVGDDRVTPTATTLGTWISTNNGFIEELIGQTPDNILDVAKILKQIITTRQTKVVSSGVIHTKGGLPSIDFTSGLKDITSSHLTELDYGNDFSISTVSSNEVNNSSGTILGIGAAAVDKSFYMFSRRDATKVIARIESTTGNVESTYLIQQNNNNQKLLTTIVTPTTIKSYFNNVIQDSETYTGSYTDNNILQLGVFANSFADLEGDIQEVIIFPSDKTSSLSTLHSDINSYYSIY